MKKTYSALIFLISIFFGLLIEGCSNDDDSTVEQMQEDPIDWEFSVEVKPDFEGDLKNLLTLGDSKHNKFLLISDFPDSTNSISLDISIEDTEISFIKSIDLIDNAAEVAISDDEIEQIQEVIEEGEQFTMILQVSSFSWESEGISIGLALSEIYTWHDLDNIRLYHEGEFRLMNNIELPDPGIDGMPSSGFQPILYPAREFAGVLDGQGYTIENLFIDQAESDNVGLFSAISGTVKNLKVTLSSFNSDYSIRGNHYVGAIAGISTGGPESGILKVHIEEGKVLGDSIVGGVSGSVSNIEASGAVGLTVEGNAYVGGVFGRQGATVLNGQLYFIGDIEGVKYVGGIGGFTQYSRLNNCFAQCNISGDDYVGGILGVGLPFENCYVVPIFQMLSTNIGVFTGNDPRGDLSSNVYYINSLTTNWADEAIGLELEEMMDASSYPSSWDFDETWAISSETNKGLPYLRETYLNEQ